jgi:ribonuclease VapC
MFVDACAIVSLLTAEPTATAYDAALGQADAPCTSVMAAWKAIIVLSHPAKLNLPYSRTEGVVVAFLEVRNIQLVEPNSPREILSHAVSVAEKHGISRRALSNFDCFHCAYAKSLQHPLLTLDERLRLTDVQTLP